MQQVSQACCLSNRVLAKLEDTLCGRVLHLGKITTISADLEVITLANHQFDS